MAADALSTADLTDLLTRIRAGDPAARNDLLRACQSRLERLARRMLRGYPSVRRWADTDDVLQNAALRLLRALDATPISDTWGFFNLAAAVIRRELIDLARHFGGRQGLGANYDSRPPREDGPPAPEPAARDPDPTELDRWRALHEAVERLPAAEREVFGLTFYHGWTQDRIAELFQVDARTIRRRWRAAVEALHVALGCDLPTD
jgi:RNA polymerase sigma factor (sigma-70 family)